MHRLRGRVSVGSRSAQRYGDRQVCADTDLHERAAEQLRRHVARGRRIADVGCGEGAFALRLANEGFEVVGLDLADASEHSTAGAYLYEQVDLASPTARAGFVDRHGGTFEAVALLEVIEHVRDPWQTLEFCRSLLRPSGILLLSTPNIASFFSRFRFMTGGYFHQFEPADFSYGHINPMTSLMVAKVMNDTGFELLEKGPGPPTPVVVWDTAIDSFRGRLLHATSYLVAAALTPLMRGEDLDGWSLIFVARLRPKARPEDGDHEPAR